MPRGWFEFKAYLLGDNSPWVFQDINCPFVPKDLYKDVSKVNCLPLIHKADLPTVQHKKIK